MVYPANLQIKFGITGTDHAVVKKFQQVKVSN